MTVSFSRGTLTVEGGHATLRRMKLSAGVLVIAMLAGSGVATANEIKPIMIIAPGERPTNNKLVLAGIAGAGLLTGAIGFYFHLDNREASNEVGTDVFTGTPWTPAHQALVDRADSSQAKAIAFYSIGGACLIGAVIYWIATDPPDETIVIRPRSAQPTVAPIPGGALLGGTWSF